MAQMTAKKQVKGEGNYSIGGYGTFARMMVKGKLHNPMVIIPRNIAYI
jgi:hypothetical protein